MQLNPRISIDFNGKHFVLAAIGINLENALIHPHLAVRLMPDYYATRKL